MYYRITSLKYLLQLNLRVVLETIEIRQIIPILLGFDLTNHEFDPT